MTHYVYCLYVFCFFKQKTAYEMRISDWSSDVCSSDLHRGQCWPLSVHYLGVEVEDALVLAEGSLTTPAPSITCNPGRPAECRRLRAAIHDIIDAAIVGGARRSRLHRTIDLPELRAKALPDSSIRSEEHTSEIQSLTRLSYAVSCF